MQQKHASGPDDYEATDQTRRLLEMNDILVIEAILNG